MLLRVHTLFRGNEHAMVGAGTHPIRRSCLLECKLLLLLLRHHVLLLFRCQDLLRLLLLPLLLISARWSALLELVPTCLLRGVLSNFLRLRHCAPLHLRLGVTRRLLLLLVLLILQLLMMVLLLLLGGLDVSLGRSER